MDTNLLTITYDVILSFNLLHSLLDSSKSSILDDWEKRRNVIIDVASGLHYLHEGSHQRIVHQDHKATSVLLDANWKAKIGDFGLVKLFELNESHRTTNHLVELSVYVSP
ncbi:putative protein kinase RLK-Pelle-DLSV family [Helianthus annuus]|nr:putative protein kinase RLK-Pelle-DLSV family [Helianthus annuus]